MAATAPVAVCCPTCWKWTELKNSTICKRCRTPLVLPDGRRVDEARDGTAPPVVAIKAPPVSLAAPMVGTDWIAIARWITVAYAALAVFGLVAGGLIVPSVTVPVQDPNTGTIVDQTVNIRPILAVAAIILIGFFALIVWLTGYGIARAIMLLVVVLEALVALSRIGAEPSAGVGASVFSLLCDAGLAYVLVMTFVAPLRPAPVNAAAALTPTPGLGLAPPPPPPPPQ